MTLSVIKRLRSVLKSKGFCRIDAICVRATDAKDIYGRTKELLERCREDETHLNYTGGTKTMAAHARLAFANAGLPPENASYLDERDAVIRFDDGRSPLELCNSDLELSMDVALAPHGATFEIDSKTPRPDDALSIAKAVLADHCDSPPLGPGLAGQLYGLHRKADGKVRSVTDAKSDKRRLTDFGLRLTVDEFPEDSWNGHQFKEYREFLDGLWFEQWVASVVSGLVGDDVRCNVKCRRAERLFELDIVVVRGHRAHVLSCTTDTTPERCKSKLFEVALRASQIGGELARSALACLLWDAEKNGPYIEQVRNDVARYTLSGNCGVGWTIQMRKSG